MGSRRRSVPSPYSESVSKSALYLYKYAILLKVHFPWASHMLDEFGINSVDTAYNHVTLPPTSIWLDTMHGRLSNLIMNSLGVKEISV